MELQKEWNDKAEQEKGATLDSSLFSYELDFEMAVRESSYAYKQGATEMLKAVEGSVVMPQDTLIEAEADNYIAQFLPHVNTTGHWVGFQEGYKKAVLDILHNLKTIKPL